MSFDIYIEEMKRLGWKEEDLKKDYELHENEIKSGQEFPWFPRRDLLYRSRNQNTIEREGDA